MSMLDDLKEKAERLCPYPVGKWYKAKFDWRALKADSAWAPCKGHKATLSVLLYPPEDIPQIVLLEHDGDTVPLTEDTEAEADLQPRQLELLELL
jgi:hypothetical protein